MRIFFTFIIFCFTQISFSQTGYSNLDTLDTYDVSLKAETGPDYARYYVNGVQVRKIIYDSYENKRDNIGKCTPCLLRTFDEDDNLIRESVQYTDCGVGKWTEYHINGRIKVAGQFKENLINNWKIDYRDLCNIKEGIWKYYDESGKLIKTETYKNNKLIESK